MNQNSLAISTAWNYRPDSDIKDMLSKIKDVGLDAIEIGYNFTPPRLKELISLIDVMVIKVVSIHNFCPLPAESKPGRFFTDCFRLSSLDDEERKKAVSYTKRTIDTACSLSCPVVIIHAGVVELKNESVKRILSLYNEGKFDSQDYRKIKNELLDDRQNQKKSYLESAVRSLEEILNYAGQAGVKIGLETRYYPHEIPNIEEADYLLNLFKDKGLLYWHDVGHAEVNERLSIASHNDYLQRFASYMLGIHLHDLIGIDDHLAPFSGDFDFSKISPYMKDGVIKVIEAHPPATAQQIKEAIRRLSC